MEDRHKAPMPKQEEPAFSPETWADWLFPGATTFRELAVGERFHFPGYPKDVCVKTSGAGWYRDSNGQRFKTGVRSAVYRVTPQDGLKLERLLDDEKTCPQCFDYVENCACGRKGK